MGNSSVEKYATISNDLDIVSVTKKIANTNCIICGKAFNTPRTGKLYCSFRCKQFGYNHKIEISQILTAKAKGISPNEMTFYIDDYNSYAKKNKMLRRYKELEKKKSEWESANEEIGHRRKLDLPISSFMYNSYTGKKLTEAEENDLYNNEMELDERILDLNPRELSLEQWSFIKVLYPSLDEISFFEVVTSLSKQFFEQLDLSMDSNTGNNEFLVIKNKFINHCNLIAMGVIQFVKKGQETE